MLTRLRSLIFMLWLYGSMAVIGMGLSPLLLMPSRYSMHVIRWWAKTVLFGARMLVGIKVEFRGLEHMPTGPALVAGKHLSMLDTIAPFAILPWTCYVLKQELMYLPFLGWYAWRTNMVPVRRDEAAKALKQMVAACRARLAEGRQIVIFPEGTRSEVGQDADYKPGVAALYRDLGVPCHLMATNSGQFWPAHGIDRKPGTVVFRVPAAHSRRLEARRADERDEVAP